MAASRGKWAVRFLAAAMTLAVSGLLRLLPLPVARALMAMLGRAAYYLVPRIRKVGLANLDLAYGDTLTRAEKKRILRAAVRNVALVAAEFPHMPRLKDPAFLERHIAYEGVEHVQSDHGTLLVGAHIGNWEWMASAIAARGFKVAGIVRPFDVPALQHYIDGTRRSCGVATISKDNARGEMLRLMSENWVTGLLADQSPRENGIPVTFFGHPCWATIGPAMLALRANMPLNPVSMARGPDGRYTLRFYPALEYSVTGNFRDDLQHVTQCCQSAIEDMIRAHPEQWLWFHRRWKERPRLAAEWAARNR